MLLYHGAADEVIVPSLYICKTTLRRKIKFKNDSFFSKAIFIDKHVFCGVNLLAEVTVNSKEENF